MTLYNEIKRLLNKKVKIQTEDSIKEVIIVDITESTVRAAEESSGESVIFQISNIGFIEYLWLYRINICFILFQLRRWLMSSESYTQSEIEYSKNKYGFSQLVTELNNYKYKHVSVQIKNEVFDGVLVFIGQSFINLVSQASLVIIPLKNVLIINVPKM